jgi:hypothetical protein
LPANVSFQSFAVYNPVYKEIYIGYSDTAGQPPNKYLLFSMTDQCYAVGSLTRVSGTHFTQGDTRPYFADSDGFIYLHENTNDADGSALPCTITLAPVALQEGLRNLNLEAILFDFFEQVGDITATVNTYDRINDASPMDTETEIVTDSGNPYTEFRVNGRYVGMVLSQNSRLACSTSVCSGNFCPASDRNVACKWLINIDAATPFPDTSPSKNKNPPSSSIKSQ